MEIETETIELLSLEEEEMSSNRSANFDSTIEDQEFANINTLMKKYEK